MNYTGYCPTTYGCSTCKEEENRLFTKSLVPTPSIFKKGELPTFLSEFHLDSSNCFYKGSCDSFDYYLLNYITYFLYIKLKEPNESKQLSYIGTYFCLCKLFEHYNITCIEELVEREEEILKEASIYRSCNMMKVKNPSIEETKDIFSGNITKENIQYKLFLHKKIMNYFEKVNPKDYQKYGLKVITAPVNIQKEDKLFNSWCCNFNMWCSDEANHIRFVSLPGCSVTGLNHVYYNNEIHQELFLEYAINTIFDFYVYRKDVTKYVILVKGDFIEEGWDTFENLLKNPIAKKMFEIQLKDEKIVNIKEIF